MGSEMCIRDRVDRYDDTILRPAASMLSKNIGKRPCIPSGNSSSSRHTRRGWFYSLRQPAVQTHHAINSYGSRLVVALPSRAAAREVSYSSVGFLGFIRAKRVSNCYMQEKKTDRLCGCVCVVVRLILVLVLRRQIVYGQNTVYLCLSKYIVFENTHVCPAHCNCGQRNDFNCGQRNGGRSCCLMHGVAHE